MQNYNEDLQQKNPEKLKQDDKFFTRLLTKESSMAQPSSRVYYGGSTGSVPFVWESEPGTPKSNSSENYFIPPLTPPPSYYSNSKLQNSIKKNSRSKLLDKLFLKIIFKKLNKLHSSSSSSSSSSLSSSSVVVPSSPSLSSLSSLSSSSYSSSSGVLDPVGNSRSRGSRFSTPSSSFDNVEEDEDEDDDDENEDVIGSSDSARCVGDCYGGGTNRGCYGR